MARIKQIGVGRKTRGTIDGVTYYVRNGVTFARATPTMPVSAYRTPAALKRQSLFKLIQLHIRYHLRTIRQTVTPKGNGTPSNRYFSLNYKAFAAALDTLADRLVAGEDITLTEVETAISTYAAAHTESIRIAHLSGYQDVYLTGAWPDSITLNALAGDSTVIIIVAENGTTTTIGADGITTVVSGSNGSSSSSGSSSGNGTNSGTGTNTGGGDNTGGNTGGSSGGSSTGSETSGTPVLTISKTGSGTASVTAGGNAVNSGAELAAETEVSLSVTPATGQTPTATLNGNTVELTESDGTYTGTFQMPSSNATLVINTGSAEGYGDTN